MADGLLRTLDAPETDLLGSMLYPLRGADAMAIMGFMAFVFWVFTVLVAEYCQTVMSDAQTLGAQSMGTLVIIITVLPVGLLLPPFVAYLLQYLGRVLVSSAKGDPTPPRMPDRNFDGLTAGLSPWLIWMLLGVSVASLPILLSSSLPESSVALQALLIVVTLVLGIPYVLISLMMSFLHDRVLAPTPLGVCGTLMKHGITFIPTFVKVAFVVSLTVLYLGALAFLREFAFWGYILLSVTGWVAIIWAVIVAMRLLGLHYHRHQDALRWHRREPRWGVRWRL